MSGYVKDKKNTEQMIKMMKDKRKFIIYDTETTGLKKNYDRVIEFSADLYEQVDKKYEKTDSIEIYINQPVKPTPETIEVNHITAEFLQDKPKESDAWKQISAFLEKHSDAVLSGYNIDTFDNNFMDNMAIRNGGSFWSGDSIDIYKVVKENIDGKYKNLSTVFAKFCPKEQFDAHNSTGDIEATWKIAVAIAKENWFTTAQVAQLPVSVINYWFKDFGGRQGKYLFVTIKRGDEYIDVMYSHYEKGWKCRGDDKEKIITSSDTTQIEQQMNGIAQKHALENFTKITFAGKSA